MKANTKCDESLNVNYKPDFPTVCLLVCNVYVQIHTQQAR